MSKENDKTDCIVVRAPCCKNVVMACVNEPSVMTTERFQEIGEAVKEGCTVEHMAVEDVRKQTFGCKCK